MKQFFVYILLLCPITLHAQNTNGFVKFEFNNADSAYMVPAYDLLEAIKVVSGDSLEFVEGVHLITLQTHFHKSKSLYIEVYKDSTVTFSYTFDEDSFDPSILTNNIAARNYYDANVIVLSDEDSDIYYEGNYKGTGFAKFNIFGEIGTLEIRNPDFGSEKRLLNIPKHRLEFIRNDLRPNKSKARLYSVFPGASQSYKRQYLKAVLLGASSLSLFTYAGIKSHKYQKELDVFYEYQESYNNANSEQEALRLGNLTKSQQNKVQNLDNQRRYLLLSGLLIYGYNIYDAFTSTPTGGFRKNDKDLEFYLSQEEISGIIKTAGTLRYNF